MNSRLLAVGCWLLAASACKPTDNAVVQLPNGPAPNPPRKEEPPVATNPDIPVEYPAALYQQGIEGRVLLKLYADSTGKLVRWLSIDPGRRRAAASSLAEVAAERFGWERVANGVIAAAQGRLDELPDALPGGASWRPPTG